MRQRPTATSQPLLWPRRPPNVETIGKYEILRKIGEGGFGVVYQARDPFLKRTVAIKTLTVDMPELRDRFFREAEVAGRLQHPAITAVFDFGFAGNTPFLVQEYLDGEDLDVVIARRPAVPLRRRVEWLIQLAQGLDYAHASGVVHRDIKPANMRLLDGQRVKIMDFGIAKLKGVASQLTRTGTTLGTAAYLPPEQLRGEAVDQRADLFSFGATAFEILAYRRAFDGTSVHRLFFQIIREDPPALDSLLPECPAVLAAAVHRCLAKRAEDRYPSCAALLEDLRRAHDELVDRERRGTGTTQDAAGADGGVGDRRDGRADAGAPTGVTPGRSGGRSTVERLRQEAQSLIARDALEEARSALHAALELAPGDRELTASLAAVEGELDRRRARGDVRAELDRAVRDISAALDRGETDAAAELLAEARLLFGDDLEELAGLRNRLGELRRQRREAAGGPGGEEQARGVSAALAAGNLRGAADGVTRLGQSQPDHPALDSLRGAVAHLAAQQQRAAGATVTPSSDGTAGGLPSLPSRGETPLASIENNLAAVGERLASLSLPAVLALAAGLFAAFALLLVLLLL